MRLLTIQLLLLGTQLISAAPGCDKTYIKGASSNHYTYTSGNKLTCNGGKEIEVSTNPGKQYSSLTCSSGTGWVDEAGITLAADNADITIACKTRAAPPLQECVQSLITNFDGAKMKYDTNKLTCLEGGYVVEYTPKSGPKQTTHTLECVAADEWKADSGKIGIKSKEQVTVACVIDPCSDGLITRKSGVIYETMPKIKLSCGKKVMIGGKYYDSLTCDKATGWKDSKTNDQVKKSTDKFTADCKALPACHEDLIKATSGVIITMPTQLTCSSGNDVLEVGGNKYDKLVCKEASNKWEDAASNGINVKGTDPIDVKCVPKPCQVTGSGAIVANNKLTCTPTSGSHLAYIELNQKKYTQLECVGTQWKDNSVDIGESTTTPLAVTCTDYCKSNIDSQLNYVEEPQGSGTYKVTCKTAGEIKGLFHGTAGNEKQVTDVTCSLDVGWKSGENILEADSIKEMQSLKCEEGCEAANVFTAEAAETSTSTGKVFKCLNEGHDSPDKNAIQLDGKFVNSHLHCDENNGWADVANKKLADAFTKVTITCDKVLCNPGTDLPCGNPDIKQKLPHGYYCEEGKPNRYPGAASGDPNLLKCKDNKRMYNFKSAKFFDKPLRCKPEEKSYAFLDDPNQEAVLSGEHTTLCLLKLCNLCQPLQPVATPPPGSVPTPSTFTAGKADECAMAKCQNDLWVVLREGEVTPEQYAGKVECSSEDTTRGKWVIDGDKKLQEGSCINQIDQCTTAALLNTECEAPWTEAAFGCTPLTLQDTGANTCTAGNLYYKAKGDYAFYQADKIECDLQKGWKVTIDKEGGGKEDVPFGRGGTVICAIENPSPVTTTTPPTTTTPFVAPCEVCPKGDDVLYSCDKCSTKKPSFDPSSDNEKCQATDVASEVSFETEKAGLVKGKLVCDKTEKIWKTEDGAEVGKFAIPNPGDSETAANTGLIIGGAVGGVVFLIAILAVIFYVLVGRKKRPNEQDEDTKRKMLEEGKKKKKTKDGDNNDEILDEVAVDAPAEIKL